MKRLNFFLLTIFLALSNAHGFTYSADNYQVYEMPPTTSSPGTIYVAPKIRLAVIDGDAPKPALIPKSALPSNAPAYRFAISSDGHLTPSGNIANFTVLDARKMGAVPSAYKLYEGHFISGTAPSFLLWDNIRDSALIDADVNETPYIYYNFGQQLNNSNYSGLELKDVDGNGLDDIITATTRGYTKVEFYSQPGTFIAANTHLQASQVGLLINDNDPYSVAIGEYYRAHRGIPDANIVHLHIQTGISRLDPSVFATIKSTVDSALPANVQAIAVAWTFPFAVGYCSITSAFAQAFSSVQATACVNENDAKLMSDSESSAYYNSPSSQPYSDYQIRPTMLLAARSIAAGEAMIDRGIASDGTHPQGAAYIIKYAPELPARSIRASSTNFPAWLLGYALSPDVNAQIIDGDSISNTSDALFYFAGTENVPNLATNNFPNGAIADTLTSYGGYLDDTKNQINILDFIGAGATGTFGTVAEPSADVAKFPKPQVVILRYTNGETLVEAYWKSISKTWLGLFVGEPLASPWQ